MIKKQKKQIMEKLMDFSYGLIPFRSLNTPMIVEKIIIPEGTISLFETERCYINTFKKPDFADVKKLYMNKDVRKYLGGIRDEASTIGVLQSMLNPSDNAFYWVIREKQTDNFIGLVYLNPHHEGIFLEVSYQLLPVWWGRGYATETVPPIIHFAFNELNQKKLVAETQTANKRSCRLLEKLGMQLECKVIRFGAEQAIYSIKPSHNVNSYDQFRV